jgi:hypothetical protein
MSFGGGGGQQPQDTTVTQTNLPEYVQPYFERLLQRGEAESLQPYTPYEGERLAFFSPDEQVAQGLARGFGLSGVNPELAEAASDVAAMDFNRGSGYTAFSNMPGYVAPQFQKEGFEAGVSRFMSPYQQAVTDIAKNEAVRASEMAQRRIEDQAAAAGGLGGYREAILQGERQRSLGQQLSDIQTKGSQSAFDRAVAQLGRERAVDLQGAQFNLGLQAQLEKDRQMQERLGQTGFDLSSKYGLAQAQLLGNLGQSLDASTAARIEALSKAGQQQRALQQASLDLGYEDFLRQQGATRDQLGFLGGLLRGVPVQPTRTVSTFQQQPGLFQSLAGLGLAGLGLYRGLS